MLGIFDALIAIGEREIIPEKGRRPQLFTLDAMTVDQGSDGKGRHDSSYKVYRCYQPSQQWGIEPNLDRGAARLLLTPLHGRCQTYSLRRQMAIEPSRRVSSVKVVGLFLTATWEAVRRRQLAQVVVRRLLRPAPYETDAKLGSSGDRRDHGRPRRANRHRIV